LALAQTAKKEPFELKKKKMSRMRGFAFIEGLQMMMVRKFIVTWIKNRGTVIK